MTGKEKCKTLRAIRMKAAQMNEIEYHFRECTYEGLCTGTCPLCEKELRELEALIEQRRASGQRIYMEYLFPIPAPEMKEQKKKESGLFKRFFSRKNPEELRKSAEALQELRMQLDGWAQTQATMGLYVQRPNLDDAYANFGEKLQDVESFEPFDSMDDQKLIEQFLNEHRSGQDPELRKTLKAADAAAGGTSILEE